MEAAAAAAEAFESRLREALFKEFADDRTEAVEWKARVKEPKVTVNVFKAAWDAGARRRKQVLTPLVDELVIQMTDLCGEDTSTWWKDLAEFLDHWNNVSKRFE